MAGEALKNRSRLLDALANSAFLDGSTPRPEEPSDAVLPDGNSQDALDALKHRLLRSAPRTQPTTQAIAGGSRAKRLIEHQSIGSSSPSSTDSSPLRSPRNARESESPENTPSKRPRGFQFNLRYDQDIPVRPIDIGGVDQEEKVAEFVAKSFDEMNQNRTVQDALRALNLQNRKDIIPGMEIRLLDHQLIGVNWMIDQELRTPYKGGILADEMGLGKTVQILALMAKNPPAENENDRSTLVVVPSALLQQWKDEFEARTNGLFSVHIHHGRTKLKTRADVASKDVVITTYQTLNTDCGVPIDVDESEKLDWLYAEGGPLVRTKWYRVVLDEAQFIRNRGSRSSHSVAFLRSKYRWTVTGTPITNTLVDIFAFLRFGRFRPWNDWRDFNEHIAKQMMKDSVLAGMRAQEILKPLLIRRTKTTKGDDGKLLLTLPDKDVQLIQVEFSEEEREIYESVEKRARVNIGRFIKRGTLMKNHAQVLVMILRLRQLCDHPFLILSVSEDAYADPTLVVGSQGDKEQSRARRLMGAAWIKEVKARFLKKARADQFDFPDEGDIPEDLDQCPMCQDMYMSDNGVVLTCGHQMCFDCTMELMSLPLTMDQEIVHDEKAEKEFEAAAAKGYRPCPTCRKLVDLQKMFRGYAFQPTEEEISEAKRKDKQTFHKKKGTKVLRDVIDLSDDDMVEDPVTKRAQFLALDDSDDDLDLPDVKSFMANATAKLNIKGKKRAVVSSDTEDEVRRQGKRARVADENDNNTLADVSVEQIAGTTGKGKGREPTVTRTGEISDAQRATWGNGDSNVEASAKMMKMMELLREWEASGDKIIVYSQWTSMLDLVESIFMRFGVRNLRYDGAMSREARDKAVRDFRQPGGPKVMLISIKCGGVGLNLVSANRVINLDLSWNYATESQAYDRVHRMGQEKPVVVRRLVVRDTLEERMLKLQDVKTGLAETALGEGTGTKLHKLSVKEIKLLFGFSSLDQGK